MCIKKLLILFFCILKQQRGKRESKRIDQCNVIFTKSRAGYPALLDFKES